MFNLIMRWFEWGEQQASIHISRVFEFTEDHLAERFRVNGQLQLDLLTQFPCLFMREGIDEQVCRVGFVNRARIVNNEVVFDYNIDTDIPPLQNAIIHANRLALDMPRDFEFSRNHWAVKDVDIYRFLFRIANRRRQRPSVFHINEHEQTEATLVSVMMPFDAAFNPVYESIQQSAANVGLISRRADDIWENPAIIQDVVSLIDRSRVVICDCTQRNPNVFYEAGIAHTLGREVILIAQADHDIPFDLRHLRYVRYLNNGEGRAALASALERRMQSILGN